MSGIEIGNDRSLYLSEKKEKALMMVIQRIINRYENHKPADNLDEGIFKLYEKAKIIRQAKNDTEFQRAIENL